MSLGATELTQAIGWTLIHSTVQFTLAWASHRVLQAATAKASARIRYGLAWAMLLVATAAAGMTLTMLLLGPPAWPVSIAAHNGLIATLRLSPPTPLVKLLVDAGERSAPWLAAAWAAYVTYRAGATAAAWRNVVDLRRRCGVLDASERPACWDRLCRVLTPGRRVLLCESARIGTPATIGWLKPIVLVPLGFLAGAPPFTVEAILAHELAHVRRWDYAVNVLQSVVEALFWFHPGVRAICRDITRLREHCADELAVRTIGDRREDYVMMLLVLRDQRAARLAVGAAGSPLAERLMSLLTERQRTGVGMLLRVGVLLLALAGSLGVLSRTAAAEVSRGVEIAESFARPLSDVVYELLDADRDNPDFVPAVVRAVGELQAGTFDRPAAVRLANVITRGGRPDYLLNASLPAFSAESLRAKPGTTWHGGDGTTWDALARSLRDFARSSSTGDRTVLARAAMLLASQRRVNSGGFALRFVFDADTAALLKMANKKYGDLVVAASAESRKLTAANSEFSRWEKSGVTSCPLTVLRTARQIPLIQWRMANLVWKVSQNDPARAEQMADSMRADVELALLAKLLDHSWTSSKDAPSHGPSGQMYNSGGGSETAME